METHAFEILENVNRKEKVNGGKQHEGTEGSATIEIDAIGTTRHIGLLGTVAFAVGSMIGSGIFISPKGALINTGSAGTVSAVSKT